MQRFFCLKMEKDRGFMRRILTRIPLALCLIVILWGCATPPKKPEIGYIFFPPPPQTPRIQFLASFSKAEDFVPSKRGFADFIVGKKKQSKDTVIKPYGVAIKDGVIYICDTGRNVIDVLDIKEKKFKYIGGTAAGKFKKPINIAIDSDGTKYIADTELGSIVVVNKEDQIVKAFGSIETMKPTAVAVYGDKLFVTDIKNHEVLVLEKVSGKLLYKIGKKGQGPGEFSFPTNISIDKDGNVYVSETGGFRVQKLTQDGKPIRTFGGGLGDAFGQFARPRGVAVDREGRVYSVDAWHSVVQIFDSEGRLLLFFGEMGNQPGNLNLPAQVVIDYDNVPLFKEYAAPDFEIEYLIIVTSQFGPRKVNVFGFGHKKGKRGA